MADISKITLPSGTTYDIKDAVARASLGGAIIIRGTTTTALTDEATTNPITIDGNSYTAVANDAVFYNKKEFVFDGTKWHEFGDMSGLGDMAEADTASTSYTPAGSVTLSGTTATVSPAESGTATYTPGGSVTLGDKSKLAVSQASSGTATYTPAGSVSLGDSAASTVSAAGSGEATYTPAGSIAVNASTGSGTAYTPEGSISVNASSGSGTSYTPEGSVTAPTISVASAGSTTTIKNPTKATVATAVTAAAPGATAPSNAITYYSVSNETLSLYQIGYNTGDSITTSDVTVKTGDASYSATQPTFSGTEKKFAFSGTQKKLAFTGTGARLVTDSSIPTTASFSGTAVRLETSQDVPGSASFSGTGVRLKVDTQVPTSASFSGTAATITVTPDSVTTISFTISGTSYTATSSMTWEAWVASAYNTAGYVISNVTNHVTTSDSKYEVHYNNTAVVKTDTIISGASYTNT